MTIRGLPLGDGAGGHRVPYRFVVVVQGVGAQDDVLHRVWSVAGAGLVRGSELEGGDPLGEPRELGQHPGHVSVADRPEPRVPELVEVGVEPHCAPGHLRMLMARASTTANVAMDTADSQAISIFAVRVKGMVSVGEKAMRLVIET